ncbi:hypothetical protein LEP1GSC151_3052 [Leptospira interrogans serovar Grippotyphosa str. LT2186]|uniref:Uncharacterized protein n=1 Tax=Leptospira interrogans serovar Grippotyphosa str. LT2186 TaxID=1001599 RepID=M3GVL1_LEPIR|nr:hypothetical protein LEP1GSC151_3052 [Leptospira interrogans serovar Grippotyphosa str. LT2186]
MSKVEWDESSQKNLKEASIKPEKNCRLIKFCSRYKDTTETTIFIKVELKVNFKKV